MKIIRFLMLAVLALVSTTAMAQQMPPIPVDENVRIGKLDNGLTYYIRHNDFPEHRVNFYIAQRVGSVQEEENQRGLAHFLEHMAFNGSEHFPGDRLIEWLRSVGVEFGGDLNAYTSTDRTVYNINDVPSTRTSTIDSCLLILKDWSNGLLLESEEIEKERGVIHEEWRLRTSAQSRMLERNLETLFPGSKYGRRYPIGLMSVVDGCDHDVLRAYYHKWYRPDNQGLVIVGDVDVDYIEARIQQLFSGITVDANAAKVLPEAVPDNDDPIIVVDQDKEMQFSIVQLFFRRDASTPEEKVNIDYMLEPYVTNVVALMLNARLTELSQEPDCPFLQAGADDDEYIMTMYKDAFTVSALPKEGQTEAAVTAIAKEVRRAAEFGFTATEYARAREEYMSQLESVYNNRNTQNNEFYALQYVENFLKSDPIPSIEQEYQIMQMIAPNIPVEAINQVFSTDIISSEGKNVVLLNFNREQEGVRISTPESLRIALDAAKTAPIEAYVDNVKDEPLITELPTPGKIVKEEEVKELGYKVLTLSNGARVALKSTDFKDNEIKLQGYASGGVSTVDPADYNEAKLFDSAIDASGLGNFSKTELDKAMAGKQASVSLGLGEGYALVEGESTVKDLETMMQLLYLKMTAINPDQKSIDNLKNTLNTVLKNKEIVPEMALSDSIQVTFYNHDAYHTPYTAADVEAFRYDRALELAKKYYGNAADFTFVLVGSFDEATVRPLIERYIASLPSLGVQSDKMREGFVQHPQGETINSFTRKMETPKAFAFMFWYNTKMPWTLDNAIKADAAGQVLDMILLKKIREDASAAYSASGGGNATIECGRPLNRIVAVCPMKPEMADVAIKIMREEGPALATNIDAEMLNKVKELMVKQSQTNARDNEHWVSILTNHLKYGIDFETNYISTVNALTPESVKSYVGTLLSDGDNVQVIMLPEE